MNNDRNLIFVPGGPCISGAYWDPFIEQYYKESSINRVILLNHETDYDATKNPTLSDLLSNIELLINQQNRNFALIGHSYGSLLILFLLDRIHIRDQDKVILTCTPFSNKRSIEVSEFVKRSGNNIQVTNNSTFQQYFESILELYFTPGANFDTYKWISKEAYLEGNQKLLMDDSAIAKCIDNLSKFQDKISFIVADNDLITGNTWKQHLHTEPLVVTGSGHFPMLERPELFSKLINSLLK